MNKTGILEGQKFVFGKLFQLSNKLQTIGDRILCDEMTITQWLLTAAVAQFGNTPPTISEIAELMDSSHQNVKQLALNLQRKGYLILEKDKEDMRATLLILTGKSCIFWKMRQEEIKQFLIQLFKDFNDDEIDLLYSCLNKLYESIVKKERVF